MIIVKVKIQVIFFFFQGQTFATHYNIIMHNTVPSRSIVGPEAAHFVVMHDLPYFRGMYILITDNFG